MLIEKKIDVNDIVTLKLLTQEEVVAKVVAFDDQTVTIQRPMVLNIAMDERTNRPGIQMYPFFILGANADSKIPLSRNHIVAILPAADEIKSGYIHNTSGITVAKEAGSGLIK